jgi:hypothetical protein
MFEPGFPVSKRLVNFAYKGVVFSGIGLLAGIIGTSISNGLLMLRKELDPTFETQNVPPSVLGNAMCWSAHMGISSNLRYQILGGTDTVSGGWGGLWFISTLGLRGLGPGMSLLFEYWPCVVTCPGCYACARSFCEWSKRLIPALRIVKEV